MGAEGFEARVRERGTTAVIDLVGEINGAAEAALGAAYDEATQEEPERVLLNFGGASYINSTGIAVIVGVLARARRDRIAILAAGLSEHYRQIFEITRLADFMTIYPDEASAVA